MKNGISILEIKKNGISKIEINNLLNTYYFFFTKNHHFENENVY